jgi:hypothetical protein
MSKRKKMSVEFTKIHTRLLQTIRTKHLQAMNNEINSALLDIYEEIGHTPIPGYKLRDDFSGLNFTLNIPDTEADKEDKTDGES